MSQRTRVELFCFAKLVAGSVVVFFPVNSDFLGVLTKKTLNDHFQIMQRQLTILLFLSFFGCQKSAQGGSRLYFLINSLLLQVNSVDQFSATVDLGDNFDGLLEA